MPCRDYPENPVVYVDRDSPATIRRLDLATRVACTVLSSLSEREVANFGKEIREWWAVHQEQDRRRLAAEKRERDKKAAKASALAKLTNEERAALGL